ncbi:MAG: ABC transporter ATP-binding protein [Butyrivibrio sp.]|nr:ABC transporter ATP-binding protein [Butyrivibrio sp.]
MLSTSKVESGYEGITIIKDISIDINKGEVVSIIGRNGVGKSTFMKTLIGLNKTYNGNIILDDKDITALPPYSRAHEGVGYVPQGHCVFPSITVEENLRVGGLINSTIKKGNYDIVYEYFPRLAQRRKQMAGTMSGGEQAMLSIGRVLIGNPKILLLDEPSEGVQPNIVSQMGEIINKIAKDLGLTVLLVEQHMGLIQQVSQRSYVMNKGNIIASLTREEILDNDKINSYLTV